MRVCVCHNVMFIYRELFYSVCNKNLNELNKKSIQFFTVGNARFCSATYRLFKVEPDDSNPSDTVIEVVYKGMRL